MTIFYFSATGNSLSVAKRIGGNLISIPQVIDSETIEYEDDIIGLVFPIYSLRPPKIVRKFLNKVKFKADYIFAIGTYGNLPGAAMYNLQKLVKKRGYSFAYTDHLLMLDNFLPVFEINKQIAKLPKKNIELMTSKIIENINNRTHLQAKASFFVRILTFIIKVADNVLSNGKQANKYIVNGNCTKCGICAKVCPAKNINVTDKVHFKQQCEGCLACVHLCPQNAIHLKSEKSSKRWRNQEVSLNEIINSNNRL